MNLDPDIGIEGNDNLELLYITSKNFNLDYIFHI